MVDQTLQSLGLVLALVRVPVRVLESPTSMLVGDAEMLHEGVGAGEPPPMKMICPGA